MAKIIQRIACKAVISSGSEILILREAQTYKDGTNIGRYHFPGGRVKEGEPFLEGLRREVFEETGLKVSVGKPFFVGEWFPEIKGTKNQIVALFFACESVGREVVLSNEHDKYEWIEPQKYKNYDLMEPEGRVICAYLGAKNYRQAKIQL